MLPQGVNFGDFSTSGAKILKLKWKLVEEPFLGLGFKTGNSRNVFMCTMLQEGKVVET